MCCASRSTAAPARGCCASRTDPAFPRRASRADTATPRRVSVALLILVVPLFLAAPLSAQRLEALRTIDLNALRGNTVANALKLHDVAVDQARGWVFCSPILTRNFLVADAAAGRMTRVIPAPWQGDFVVSELAVNPLSWMLLARRSDEPSRLYGIAMMGGALQAVYDAPTGAAITSVAVDAERNRVFVADGSPVVRVLDGGSLRQMDTIAAPGLACGGLALDSARRELWMVSRDLVGGKALLRSCYTLGDHTVMRNLSYRSDEPLGRVLYNPADGRIVLLGRHAVMVIGSAGTQERLVPVPGGIADADIDQATGTLFIVDDEGYSAEGEHGCTGKIHCIDLASGRRDSIRAGQHVVRCAVAQQASRLALSSPHSNRILLVDCRSRAVVAEIDAGESAESLAYDALTADLYIADRLGDLDGIARLNLRNGNFDMLRSGNWPVMIAFDGERRELAALDHLESALSLFAAEGSVRTARVRFDGIAEARSDDLSHLATDAPAHLALACIPERERWVLVDMATRAVLRSGAVDGYAYVESGGPGSLQGALAPRLDAFGILRLRERVLSLFRLSTGGKLRDVDLAGMDWTRVADTRGELLFADEDMGLLFAGPAAVDIRSGEVRLRALERSARAIGISRDGATLVGLAVEHDSLRVTLHNRATLALYAVASLQAASYGTPVALFDAESAQLFTAEFQHALVRQFDLGRWIPRINAVQAPEERTLRLSLYPNPAPAGTDLTVTLPPLFSPDNAVQIVLVLSDALGRCVYRSARTLTDPTAVSLQIPGSGLAPGCYVLQVMRGQVSTAVRIVLIR